MSGKFNTRGNKRTNHKVIGIAVIGVVLTAFGSLYFLQPKPPVAKEVREEISLSIDSESSLTDHSVSAPRDSALPSLPEVSAPSH